MMKRILLALCLIFVTSVSMTTYAQKASTQEQKNQKIVEKMDSLLSLSQEQKVELLELYSKPKDKRGKVNSQIKEILTAEQYEKYQENKVQKKEEKEGENEGSTEGKQDIKEKKSANKKGGRKAEGEKKGRKK